MVSIRFQNPTQGPLISISLGDNDGVALAFVPAALSSAPADIAATSAAAAGGSAAGIGMAGPLGIAAICSGDSSPRHRIPEIAAQPLRGLSRFRSAVASAQGVDVDARPVAEVVALPGEATESTTTVADVARSIDWAALLAEDSNRFFSEAHGQIAKWRQEASRRLSEGESAESVSEWLRTVAIPEIDRISDVASRYTGYPMNSIQYDFTLQLFWDLDRCRRTPISY